MGVVGEEEDGQHDDEDGEAFAQDFGAGALGQTCARQRAAEPGDDEGKHHGQINRRPAQVTEEAATLFMEITSDVPAWRMEQSTSITSAGTMKPPRRGSRSSRPRPAAKDRHQPAAAFVVIAAGLRSQDHERPTTNISTWRRAASTSWAARNFDQPAAEYAANMPLPPGQRSSS
ncbi:MAG: hypothetical protein R2856_11485 [Caldilineaceae bacterium]